MFRAALGGAPRATLAFEALCDALSWWCGALFDADQRPRRDVVSAWLEAFSVHALERDAEIVAALHCVATHGQVTPWGELFVHVQGARAPGPRESLVEWSTGVLELLGKQESSDARWVEAWWSLRGGSIGTATRLLLSLTTVVRDYRTHPRLQPVGREVVCRRSADRIGAGLVALTGVLLANGALSIGARAWSVEYLVHAAPELFAALLGREQEPWLRARL